MGGALLSLETGVLVTVLRVQAPLVKAVMAAGSRGAGHGGEGGGGMQRCLAPIG